MPEINNQPNDEVQEKLRKLARGITEEIPPDWGFVLMAFPLRGGGINYISNGKRKHVMKLLRDFVYKNKDVEADKKLEEN
jgi:hypothetical protein